MNDDEPLGLRGPGDLPPRWRHVETLLDEMARAHAEGGLAASEGATHRIVEATLVGDVDAQGLDIRARALSNLAAIAEARGAFEESIALATQAIELYERVETELGTQRRTVDARIGCLINRAQTHALRGDHEHGLADLDAAAEALDAETPPMLVFGFHNTRANALLVTERFEEAEAEFRRALDVALACEPRLAAHAYAGLAALAHRTGDRALAEEQMRLSTDLQATDAASAARADENLARMLLEHGEVEEAETRLAAAEEGYRRGGDPRGAAGSRFARAAVLFARGRLRPARKLATEALGDFTAQGDIAAQIETHLLLGDLHARARRFTDADRDYMRARELCDGQETMHALARIDVRRASLAYAATGAAIRPSEQRRRLELALSLALPAALATDAMRARFAPGPARERWVTGVASVALTTAFEVITAMRHTRLAVELMEFAASSTTLEPGWTADRERLPLQTHARSPFDVPFALAAGAGPTASAVPEPRTEWLGLPPRLRAMTDGSREFHRWIAEAEHRYRLRIRSDDVIDAW